MIILRDYYTIEEQREFGARETKLKKRSGSYNHNATMKEGRYRNKMNAYLESLKKADEARAAGDEALAAKYDTRAKNALNKAEKAFKGSSRDFANAVQEAEKLARKTPFTPVAGTADTAAREIKVHNGTIKQTMQGFTPSNTVTTSAPVIEQGQTARQVKNQRRRDAKRQQPAKASSGKNVVVVSEGKYTPAPAAAPTKVNTQGVEPQVSGRNVKVVKTEVNNVGNEVVSPKKAASTPTLKYRAATAGEVKGLNGNTTRFLTGEVNKANVATKAKEAIDRRTQEAAEKASREVAVRTTEEKAARAASEAAENKATKAAVAEAKAVPGFFKRNKKALMIGGGVAALGGAGLYGYKKYKDNKR